MRRALSCGLVALALTAGAAGGTFVNADTLSRLVWVPVIVTDQNDRLVTSLRADDFAIVADDKPREIKLFSTNEMAAALSLMFDVSGSMRKQLMPTRRAARLLLDELVRGDRVNIGAFDRAVLVSTGFTANRKRLHASLDTPLTGAASPCTPFSAQRRIGSTSEPAPPSPGGGTAMWDAIWCAVSELQRDSESIRKVLVLLTDGMENSSLGSQTDAIRRVQGAGIVVYTVGFLGIQGGLVRANVRLRDLALDSGGAYFKVEDHEPIEPVFARIGQELRSQYMLAFETESASGPLKVTVRTPGLKARARNRY